MHSRPRRGSGHESNGDTPTTTPDGTRVVTGAGTGFGVAALAHREGQGGTAIVGEGGHATLPVTNEIERQLSTRLTPLYGRCSIERALSGAGLQAIYALHAQQHDLSLGSGTPHRR